MQDLRMVEWINTHSYHTLVFSGCTVYQASLVSPGASWRNGESDAWRRVYSFGVQLDKKWNETSMHWLIRSEQPMSQPRSNTGAMFF